MEDDGNLIFVRFLFCDFCDNDGVEIDLVQFK